jgi:metallo-beta-lactamase family protein
MIQLSFHGAARTVTGSKHLISLSDGRKILLDCGMFQGHGKDTDNLNRHFGFDPAELTAVVLSHGHIDHCGLIPRLFMQGFTGKVFCTRATMELTEILLHDSARIQEADMHYLNKRRRHQGRPLIKALYDTDDVDHCLKYFVPVPYGRLQEICEGVQVRFTDAGHIIGSASVSLDIFDEGVSSRIFFSGDIGRYESEILRSPEPFEQPDYILCESTYGNELHDPPGDTAEALLHWIQYTCTEKGGKLIIPAFSVGRTQEILYHLNSLYNSGRMPLIDVFVDSPLSLEATDLVRKHRECYNDKVRNLLETDVDPFGFPGIHFIKEAEQSKLLNFRTEPCVIISASGMADAGRIKHHIANNILNPANTIVLVGYCEPGSLGGRLMKGDKEVRIFGEEYQVRAEVASVRSLSAHGDYRDMLRFLSCIDSSKVKKLFLVHGEYTEQILFREKLRKAGFPDIEIPDMHSRWKLEE